MSDLKPGDIAYHRYGSGNEKGYFKITRVGKSWSYYTRCWNSRKAEIGREECGCTQCTQTFDAVCCKLVAYEDGSIPASKNLKEREYYLTSMVKVTPEVIEGMRSRAKKVYKNKSDTLDTILKLFFNKEQTVSPSDDGSYLSSSDSGLLRND